jgi:hypothetical protein
MKKIVLLFSVVLTTYVANAQAEKKLNEQPPSNVLSVYPNPATDFIAINNDETIKSLYIYNLAGRKMKTFEVEKGTRYEVMDLPNGLYFVHMINKNNKTTVQRLTKKS